MSELTKVKIGNTVIDLVQGDITKESVDAIVNAANSTLLGGGGVDGAIHRAAGRELLAECMTLGGCKTGEAKITKGYNLPAKHVIHTVGPVYHSVPNPAELLSNAHQNSLKRAQENKLKTIAFPAISTGVYSYPLAEAADVALNSVVDYIKKQQPDFELLRFVLFSADALSTFKRALYQLTQRHDDVKSA